MIVRVTGVGLVGVLLCAVACFDFDALKRAGDGGGDDGGGADGGGSDGAGDDGGGCAQFEPPGNVSVYYVDAQATGPSFIGSKSDPIKTIGAAIGASTPGGYVLIAEGQYAESLLIAGRNVNLYGGYFDDFNCRGDAAHATVVTAPGMSPALQLVREGSTQQLPTAVVDGIELIGNEAAAESVAIRIDDAELARLIDVTARARTALNVITGGVDIQRSRFFSMPTSGVVRSAGIAIERACDVSLSISDSQVVARSAGVANLSAFTLSDTNCPMATSSGRLELLRTIAVAENTSSGGRAVGVRVILGQSLGHSLRLLASAVAALGDTANAVLVTGNGATVGSTSVQLRNATLFSSNPPTAMGSESATFLWKIPTAFDVGDSIFLGSLVFYDTSGIAVAYTPSGHNLYYLGVGDISSTLYRNAGPLSGQPFSWLQANHDPMARFADPKLAGDHAHLSEGSAAIADGLLCDALDVDGDARPAVNCSIGADEP